MYMFASNSSAFYYFVKPTNKLFLTGYYAPNMKNWIQDDLNYKYSLRFQILVKIDLMHSYQGDQFFLGSNDQNALIKLALCDSRTFQ